MHRKIIDIKSKALALLALLVACMLMRVNGILCFIKLSLGIVCPFCGMTRAAISALTFDFSEAMRYHPMFWSLPILLGYFLFDGNLFNKKLTNSLVLGLLGIGYFFVWILRIFEIIPKV